MSDLPGRAGYGVVRKGSRRDNRKQRNKKDLADCCTYQMPEPHTYPLQSILYCKVCGRAYIVRERNIVGGGPGGALTLWPTVIRKEKYWARRRRSDRDVYGSGVGPG